MKYTEYNLLNLLRYISAVGERIPVFTGSDAMAYTNLEFGGAGAVIAVSNVSPEGASSIFDLYSRGELRGARQAQMGLLPAIEAIGMGDFPAGLKEAMRVVGMSVGGVREPLGPLNQEQKATVGMLLKEAGLVGRREEIQH
jgi:4-hydroxy-tetrahydrodipicolinate synthase